MDDALRVGVVKRPGHLLDDVGRGQQVDILIEKLLAQRAALDQAHHDVGHALVLAVVVNRHNRGVFQPGDDFRFPLETPEESRVFRQLAREHFKRDKALEGRLVGPVDGRHSTFADYVDDFILADCLAYHVDLYQDDRA